MPLFHLHRLFYLKVFILIKYSRNKARKRVTIPTCFAMQNVLEYHKKNVQQRKRSTVYSRIYSALVFADFLNEKKLVRGSSPHLSFNRPVPTRQTD